MTGMQFPGTGARHGAFRSREPASGKRKLSSGAQRGFSMIEMLVSIALGLAVSGAVLHAVSASQRSSRQQEAQARMNDSAQMALAQLAEHGRMAGFWVPSSEVLTTDGSMTGTAPLTGCRHGFENPAADWSALRCRPAPTAATAVTHDALALRFQVQRSGRNWDCAGNALVSNAMNAAAGAAAARVGTTHVPPAAGVIREEVQEVWYVAPSAATGNPALFCKTPSASEPVLLADNVERFQVRYAVAQPNPDAGLFNTPFDPRSLTGATTRYLAADELKACAQSGPVGADSWCAVIGMRICLVLRTDDGVNAEPSPHVACDGLLENTTDRRHRQAFEVMVSMRNKVRMP